MMTGCLALIKSKSHLACNKMTLGPSENFAGSSRSSSADLSLVPVFNIAISLKTLYLFFPHICDYCQDLYRLNSSLNWPRPPWPKANLSTKGAVCNFTYVPHSPRAK